MNKEEYFLLYDKVFSGKATPMEAKQLLTYLDDFELNDQPWDMEQMGSKELTRNKIYHQLQEHVVVPPPTKSVFLRTRWLVVAAALIGICLFTYLFYEPNITTRPALVKKQPVALKGDVLPGGDKAVLTLADGSQIVLDHAGNGSLARQGNATIDKTKNGQIVYAVGKNSSESAVTLRPAEWNVISTPRGGQFNLVLSDGTKVWLNAASTLKFPAGFSGKERIVELNGEAYFEVAKNKQMPFKVKVNKMEVEVLGTHFNVMAYSDEPKIRTILLEGSVKINNGTETALLKPGQQAMAGNADSYLKIEPANTEEVTAWKSGYFLFSNENIQSIMRKISRWYNVEVIYKGNVEHMDFDGTISRYKNVTEVLKMLELTGAIHFKVEEGRIIVMP
uniref:FecR family protein n=1 Tax=Pedobacter schmidteae TaxID=2201271 RepID=UPI000EB36167|nr:FecR family protein [Pedobacter schmidteae]